MDDALADRVDALERAVTDGECEFTELTEEADARQRLADLETQLDAIDDRVAELEAATQALRGYVGNIRSVNRDVEQRAETALAKAASIEAAIEGPDQGSTPVADTVQEPSDCQTQAASPDGGFTQPDRQASPTTGPGDVPGHGSRDTAADSPDHCHACGRAHAHPPDQHSQPRGDSPAHREPTATDQQLSPTGNQQTDSEWQPTQADGAATATDHEPSQTDGATEPDEEMLPEEAQETGTLQRVRELL